MPILFEHTAVAAESMVGPAPCSPDMDPRRSVTQQQDSVEMILLAYAEAILHQSAALDRGASSIITLIYRPITAQYDWKFWHLFLRDKDDGIQRLQE